MKDTWSLRNSLASKYTELDESEQEKVREEARDRLFELETEVTRLEALVEHYRSVFKDALGVRS